MTEFCIAHIWGFLIAFCYQFVKVLSAIKAWFPSSAVAFEDLQLLKGAYWNGHMSLGTQAVLNAEDFIMQTLDGSDDKMDNNQI